MSVKLEEDVVGVLLGELRGGRERERGLCKCTGRGCSVNTEGRARDMGSPEHGVWIKKERKKRKKELKDDSIKTPEKRTSVRRQR